MPQIEGETYFNNFEQTGYEEMAEWTPTYYQEIKEADVNLRFAGKTIDLMAQSLEDWCANMFIDTMGEEALSRMETFYYMENNSSRPIEERRRLLKAAQLGSGKMNRDRIGRMVESYTGVYPTFEFIHRLEIKAGFDEQFSLVPGDLMKFLRKNIPAHIDFVVIFDIWVVVNSHDLEQVTLPNITIRCIAPMWDYTMLDGSWYLDGSVLLDQGGRYVLAPRLNAKFSIVEPENTSGADMALHIPLEIDEGFEMDSLVLVTGIAEENSIGTGLLLVTDINDIKEAVGEISIAVYSSSCWVLDGSVIMNGSRYLDSFYRKEIIE